MQILKKPVVIIVGPTAVGKTGTSILVASGLNGEIISADSMQIYKYMDIGTAKPTREEMKGIKHYMIDMVLPDQDFTVADFQRMARTYIKHIHNKGKLPIIVGGTGLYINSLVYNLDFTETVSDPGLRKELRELAGERGNEYLHGMLEKVDAETAARLHPNDVKRVIRALEVYHCSGKPASYFHRQPQRNNTLEYNPVMIGLRMNRKDLYRRINDRVDKMIAEGLVEEVKSLLERGYAEHMPSMQGLGYKEIIYYLEGKCTLEEAVYIIKRDTRRFAKRQFTWFRRDDRIFWVDVENFDSMEDIADFIIEHVSSRLRV